MGPEGLDVLGFAPLPVGFLPAPQALDSAGRSGSRRARLLLIKEACATVESPGDAISLLECKASSSVIVQWARD